MFILVLSPPLQSWELRRIFSSGRGNTFHRKFMSHFLGRKERSESLFLHLLFFNCLRLKIIYPSGILGVVCRSQTYSGERYASYVVCLNQTTNPLSSFWFLIQQEPFCPVGFPCSVLPGIEYTRGFTWQRLPLKLKYNKVYLSLLCR